MDNNVEEQYPERLYFSIKEVASMLEVPTSTLRFWGKTFSQIKIRKNGKGDRLYQREDIALLRTIHHLVKEKGYTLEGAKKALDNSNAIDKVKLIERLERVRVFLKELRKNL